MFSAAQSYSQQKQIFFSVCAGERARPERSRRSQNGYSPTCTDYIRVPYGYTGLSGPYALVWRGYARSR